MKKKNTIKVQETEIRMLREGIEDYISITDIAKTNPIEPRITIQNWMRTRGTIDFLGTWESVHNPDFNRIEFDAIMLESGKNAFSMSPTQWIDRTHAVGIKSKSGRHGGGTFAHKDIAIAFCYWLSPVFQVYLVKEFQRLQQQQQQTLEWDVRRILAKVNYHIHTDSVREHRVPLIDWNTKREAIYQASEADLLNIVVFGQTARQWQQANPEKPGNQRDHASPEQLVVLANMEAINAELMREGLEKRERFQRLAAAAQYQLSVLGNLRLGGMTEEQQKLE